MKMMKIGKIGKLGREEDGQTLVVVAGFMGLLSLGFLAFAIDIGTLFREKRMAQAAADAAALSAAEESLAGNSGNKQAAANAMAALNGFDTTLAIHPATVTLSTPGTGNFTGSAYVQATVSRPVPTIFMGAFKSAFSTMSVSATAIAGGGTTSQTCVCLEGTSGEALNMSNNSHLNASGCGIVDDSTSSNAAGVVGSASVNAATLGLASSTWNQASNVNNGGSLGSTTVVTGVTSTCNPALPAVPAYTPASCLNDPSANYGTYPNLGPASASGVICYKALSIGANGSICTLNPGTYVINSGTLHFFSNGNLGGDGVFFYLTGNASLVIDNGANINLVAGGATTHGGGTAPTVGAYNGIVLFQDPSDTQTVSIQGGSNSYINGALVAPSANIHLGNGSSATVKSGIIASSLTMDGGGTLTAVADIPEGSLSTGNAKLVQ